MKKLILFACAALVLFFLVPAVTVGQSSWWEKGTSIFKAVQEDKTTSGISVTEIAQAFKEALSIGSENVVKQLGTLDGFYKDSQVRIPLPQEFHTVKTMLAKVGMSHLLDDLELKLNRAAEVATPKAKDLFLESIREMTFDDAMKIYKGPEDSATQYFQAKMSPALAGEMSPVVEQSLSQVGAVQAYDAVMGQYQSLPFVPDVKADLTHHVVEKGMDGIFYYIAREEAAIRSNPAKRSTELLKRVFGAQ